MTRTDARMIAEELFKMIKPLVVEQLSNIASEVTDETFNVDQVATTSVVNRKQSITKSK